LENAVGLNEAERNARALRLSGTKCVADSREGSRATILVDQQRVSKWICSAEVAVVAGAPFFTGRDCFCLRSAARALYSLVRPPSQPMIAESTAMIRLGFDPRVVWSDMFLNLFFTQRIGSKRDREQYLGTSICTMIFNERFSCFGVWPGFEPPKRRKKLYHLSYKNMFGMRYV